VVRAGSGGREGSAPTGVASVQVEGLRGHWPSSWCSVEHVPLGRRGACAVCVYARACLRVRTCVRVSCMRVRALKFVGAQCMMGTEGLRALLFMRPPFGRYAAVPAFIWCSSCFMCSLCSTGVFFTALHLLRSAVPMAVCILRPANLRPPLAPCPLSIAARWPA